MSSSWDPEVSSSFSCYFCKKSGHTKKNYMKYKKMLKKKSGKNSYGASEKAGQAGIVKQADEDPCDVLTAQSGKGKYSNVWLLDSGCTYHMCYKKGVVRYI